MAIEAVVQFLEATAKNPALRAGLAGVIGVGDGDISSAGTLDQEEAGALLGQRGVLVSTFAEQSGYAFTVAELRAVIEFLQRFQAGELSAADFSTALGLGSFAISANGRLESLGETVGMVFLGVKYNVKKEQRSAHQVLDFMKKTAEDAQLREQLREILRVGDGDISDVDALDAEELRALQGSRGALVAEFAARHGYVFTLSDLIAVTDAFQRVQSGQLGFEEFEKFLRLNVSSRDFFPFIESVVAMTYKGFGYANPVTSNAQDNTLAVVRFMERSERDVALQKQLASVLGGDGNISHPTQLDPEEARALGSDRSKQIIALGAEHGFRFTESDLGAVVGAFQMVKDGELSMESCTRILGLGKSQAGLSSAGKAAQRIYRGVLH